MVKSTILIVEDEADIANLLQINLESAGYRTLIAADGFQALDLVDQHQIDLILLDLMLPQMDGLEVCRKIRTTAQGQEILIIMLTAKGEEMDKVIGFELGADDYVVKPFSIRELLLRIKALLKRRNQGERKLSWQYKGLKLDLEAMEFYLDGHQVSLTNTEFNLLKVLTESKNRVLTREILLDKVWGYDFEGYSRTVDTHIRRLRVKLGPYARLIKTIRGAGYKLQLDSDN